MRLVAAIAVSALTTLASIAHAEVTFDFIGSNVYATDMSADGAIIVGNTQGEYETFVWTEGGGVIPLGRSTTSVLGTGAGAPEVSANGARISATILGADSTYMTQGVWEAPTQPARRGAFWTETMPPTLPDGGLLDSAYGSAWGISGDGSTLVGLYWRPGSVATGLAHPSSWTAAGGLVDLGTAGGSGRANAANHDGSVIVGWEEDPGFGTWWPTVWVDGVRTNLSTEDYFHQAVTVNPAGTIIGGHAPELPSGLLSGALWRWNGLSWDQELLGTLPGHHATFGLTTVNDMTPDASVVVGYDRRSSPGDATGFLWTEATGIMNVTTFLSMHGVAVPAGFVIRTLSAISDDGLTICGSGEQFVPPFDPKSFVIRLDTSVSAPTVRPEWPTPLAAFPNPTRGATTLSLDLPRTDRLQVDVHDATGRLVRNVLPPVSLEAGRHQVAWDGRDRFGGRVAPGVYLFRVHGTEARASKKIVVVR